MTRIIQDQIIDLGNGWDVEIRDDPTVFIRYRGIDLVAVWLPSEGGRDLAEVSVTVPSVGRVIEAAVADSEYDRIVEFGVADETDLDLSEHIMVIDRYRKRP